MQTADKLVRLARPISLLFLPCNETAGSSVRWLWLPFHSPLPIPAILIIQTTCIEHHPSPHDQPHSPLIIITLSIGISFRSDFSLFLFLFSFVLSFARLCPFYPFDSRSITLPGLGHPHFRPHPIFPQLIHHDQALHPHFLSFSSLSIFSVHFLVNSQFLHFQCFGLRIIFIHMCTGIRQCIQCMHSRRSAIMPVRSGLYPQSPRDSLLCRLGCRSIATELYFNSAEFDLQYSDV